MTNAGRMPALPGRSIALRLFSGGGFGGVGAGGSEAVADPGFGEDVFGLGGVGFQFFAKLVNDYAEVFGFFAVVRSPDGLQEATMRQRLALIGNQVLENVEFLGR